MKILLVTEFFPTGKDLKFSGGVEARTFFVAKYLALRNQVTILASRSRKTPQKEIMFNFEIYRVGPIREYYATVGDVIKRALFLKDAIEFGRELDADIVEGSNFISHFIAAKIAQSKKIPAVAWYPDVWIGSWIKNSGLVGILGEVLERINMKLNFGAYIAISRETAKKLEKYSKDKISVIPCGVEISEFMTKVPKQKFLTIVCLSRLVKYKRVEDLIWAYALIYKKKTGIRLTIVGSGPDEKRLKDINKMLKIYTKVSFINNLSRNDLIQTIKSAHLFCLPSEVEGFGISIIEAAAAGVPYVISDIPVFQEITKKGQGGLFFHLGNIQDLASKIEKLLTDRDLYKKKQKGALSLAKNYQWSKIAQQTERVYNSLLSSS